MKRFCLWSFAFAVLLGATVYGEAPAWAETKVKKNTAMDSGPIVRRQLLHRSSRLEVAPLVGFTLNDAFIRNTLAGVNVNYHLNNSFGLGLTASYGLLHSETDLHQNVVATLQEQDDATLAKLSFSQIDWAVDLGLSYVPIFGKFSVMNSFVAHYDLHLIGGLGVVGESAVPAVDGSNLIDNRLTGTRPGGMVGFGLRMFVNDMISINYQVRDYIFSRAEVSRGAANPQLTNTFVMSLGVGIFFPGDVKISR